MTTPPGPNPYQTNPPTTPTPPGQPWQPPTGWPGHPTPYYVPAQRTNGLAVASMVLGILWLYWIGSILALIFGLVLGWVCVGTLTVVMFFALFLDTRY